MQFLSGTINPFESSVVFDCHVNLEISKIIKAKKMPWFMKMCIKCLSRGKFSSACQISFDRRGFV